MSLAVSNSPHLGQVSADSNMIGIRSSLVPDVVRKLSAQVLDGASFVFSDDNAKHAIGQSYLERTVESNGKDFKASGSQAPVVNSCAQTVSAGICSIIRTEDGVAEFRGPAVHGLVRFAQMSELESQIEASFDGLTPGLHSWSVNEYGDVREGAASTGLPYSPFSTSTGPSGKDEEEVEMAGMLGTLMADSTGHAEFSSRSSRLAVWDIIGRSVVVYQSSHRKLQNTKDAIACAVIARSSVPGTGRARLLCSCDGTVIWQSAVVS
ncbi:hypothetical protein Mapa_016782 [Marchantia paleacea]|nr:hypothetical protein Mapa_016782 [Marchantia paleacea]